MGRHWSLQDAKNKFSAVVDAAQQGEPQHVTKRGVDAVVVVFAEEFERLSKLDTRPAKTFVDHLMNFPPIPPGFEDIFEKRDPGRIELAPCDIEFD